MDADIDELSHRTVSINHLMMLGWYDCSVYLREREIDQLERYSSGVRGSRMGWVGKVPKQLLPTPLTKAMFQQLCVWDIYEYIHMTRWRGTTPQRLPNHVSEIFTYDKIQGKHTTKVTIS